MKNHRQYVNKLNSGDAMTYLRELGLSHQWSSEPDRPAENYGAQFKRNCNLFKFYPVFMINCEGPDKTDDLFNGRFEVTLGTYTPIRHQRRPTPVDVQLNRIFGLDTFKLPERMRGRLTECAKMEIWAGGDSLSYPPLPVIDGVGEVPYHAYCDFTARAPKLWTPSDLRRFLQARHLNVCCVCINGFGVGLGRKRVCVYMCIWICVYVAPYAHLVYAYICMYICACVYAAGKQTQSHATVRASQNDGAHGRTDRIGRSPY